MTDTFTFNWNIVSNIVMASASVGLFIIARRRQTNDVRLVTDPVSREHCTEMHRGTDTRLVGLEIQFTEFKVERRKDINVLHEKINMVDRRLAGIETATEFQNQQLARMEAKLDRPRS